MAGKHGQRGFGHIRKLPSKRWQASYLDPDGRMYVTDSGESRAVRHTAPSTFDTREDAEAWLADRRREIAGGDWAPPSKRKPMTFREHAERWLSARQLKPRTRYHYRCTLDARLLPTFGELPLKSITADLVEAWHYEQGTATPTATSHAYGLLRTIMVDAVQRRLIEHNPVHIRGAGNVKRVRKIKPASLAELDALVEAMPAQFKLMTLLAAWCGLRFGELTELRRADVDTSAGAIHVRRAAIRVSGDLDKMLAGSKLCECRPGCVIGPPKSDAGVRDVAIPPHLLPLVREHLRGNISGGKDGLLFPAKDGGHLAPSSLYGRAPSTAKRGNVRRGWGFYQARVDAGRPDLRWHDLRHTGAVLAASTGATLAELMGRLGHSTPAAALRYQHAADGRDAEIARRLSALVEQQ